MKSDFTKGFESLFLPIDDETEYIPLLADDEDELEGKMNMPDVLPVLPLRNTVLFPGVVIPITVGRDKSVKLIQDVYKKNKILGAVSQINPNIEEPKLNDLIQSWHCCTDTQDPGNARRVHISYYSRKKEV